MYAQLCLRLSEEAPNFDDPGKTGNSTFRRLLLKQCEEEFNNRSKASQAFDKKDDLTQEEEEERGSTKRKMLGNIRFIGELAKLDMLHETILHKCIKQLLDKKKRASVADTSEDMECLCHLMKTVGSRIDGPKAKPLVDQYFERIYQIRSRSDLPSRIRFMLEGIEELRTNKWIPRKVARDVGPKPINQIRQEAFRDFPPSYPVPHGMLRNSPPHPGPMFGRHPGGGKPAMRQMEPNQGHGFNDVFLRDDPGRARFDDFGGMMDNKAPYGLSYNEDEFDRFTPKDPWAGLANTSIRSSPPLTGSPPSSRHPHYGGSPPSSRNQQYGSRRPPPRPIQLNTDGEISLRPARDSIAAKTLGLNTRPQGKVDPLNRNKAPPIIEKTKPKKPQGPSKADLEKQMTEILKAYLDNKNDTAAIRSIQAMKTNKNGKMQVFHSLEIGLDKNDEERHLICQLLQAMHKEGLTSTYTILQGLQGVLEGKADSDDGHHVKDYIACMAARTIIQGLVTLSDVCKLMDGGNFYPTLLLILKKLEQLNGQEWLMDAFNEAKIDLLSTLPESSRNSCKMMVILEEQSLSFLFPLLRIQAELYKKIEEDPNSSAIYKWIKDNVDASLHDQPEFINAITTCILRYATQQSTLGKGVDISLPPDKDLVEKEIHAIKKLKPLLDKFLLEKIDLQVCALYALQVFCHTNNHPKGLLLRMFMLLYDLEVVDEEAFVKWKEDVNEKYPGKGKALFQVNTWLTWLETADEEGSESEPE
ncbi:eukaryotic translation initiation factor 4 gamma 2 [Nematostella vectensis]|uniref:eukaryotic translation initiation factor 4 gamma 2 n=1 Tax=Nematostella vectensis TaxID=45351 RepID=UPI0020774C01|nr:eukaryotic translation initiation factor 4 gamma 2 [Nematostella vectensis]